MDRFIRHPKDCQEFWGKSLLASAKGTEWGTRYGYGSIQTLEEYARRVPVQTYETLRPYIERMLEGGADVLWPGRTRFFSKSSGTTGSKSKFIPVSKANLKTNHIRGNWDAISLFHKNRKDASIFEHKSLIMGGSLQAQGSRYDIIVGDISAIMINDIPKLCRRFFISDFEAMLLDAWEEKLERLAEAGVRERNIVMMGGVPTWTILVLQRILDITGKAHMLEVWPRFQWYAHGGVSFLPYEATFKRLFPGKQVSFQTVYNASEGYFAVQDDFCREDMLLLLNHGIYYEFIPQEDWGQSEPRAIPLWEVELDKPYALVISTNSGLWRYTPGDTVKFTSLYPFRIVITGRTKQFINVFGEEVMIDNTDRALSQACQAHDATVVDYTVAPIFLEGRSKGGHEWLIEFERAPADLGAFEKLLDANLQKLNSDYEAKRQGDLALGTLKMRALPKNIFLRWLSSRRKLGGQTKVPRLANDRCYVDDILAFMGSEGLN